MAVMRESDSLKLKDGRVLSFAIYGSPVPSTSVFYFHSFASSRKEGKIFHSAAAKLGVRLVVPDRPGLGNSTPKPGRCFLDWSKDVLALADHLKIQTFYVMGWSGGGPYVLACVKSLPKERLAGAAVVSGLYPTSLGTAGMMPGLRIMIWAGSWASGIVSTVADMFVGKAARDPDPRVYEETLAKAIDGRPEIDKRAMKDERNWPGFCEGTREGLRQGGQGTGVENKLNSSPWGFELSELKVGEYGVPLTLWHGSEDINCPPAMVQKAQELLSGAKLNMMKGEGHASFAFNHQEEILGDLIRVSEL
ncbi:alpha/beta hydrolase fold domain-containing protein [Bimuria novae-zelandiae CBS 107.79]|uniref:Alpha/beta hydrolase fold domain-containing protein n=1 Tax=Bimuria novae-zelandiae CBS 107.79 TaxID=1447943 RepID=A0A6A5VCM1_9PLEO|nr:alpha/beta hydrolase fold domain-containing protein [Bimuria novae-zelandiae CBS 107.79]